MELSESEIARQAAQLGTRLVMRGLRLATAESCTGGWIAKVFTDIAGSSDWFECSIVSYSNRAKQHYLNVPDGLLLDYGAVSENTVLAMQQGLMEFPAVDIGLSVSGIAGPGGGTAEKPVGTVWMAWGVRGQMAQTQKFVFDGDRRDVRLQSVQTAIELLSQLVRRETGE